MVLLGQVFHVVPGLPPPDVEVIRQVIRFLHHGERDGVRPVGPARSGDQVLESGCSCSCIFLVATMSSGAVGDSRMLNMRWSVASGGARALQEALRELPGHHLGCAMPWLCHGCPGQEG